MPLVSTTLAKVVEKFATGIFDTSGNLPPVSTTIFVDTGGKFATGVVDTGDAP
jgi:hypothetical protein